jgi:hypothetical protein
MFPIDLFVSLKRYNVNGHAIFDKSIHSIVFLHNIFHLPVHMGPSMHGILAVQDSQPSSCRMCLTDRHK